MHDISNSLTATNTIYLTYLLPNLIFIYIIQDHLQEVTIMFFKIWCKNPRHFTPDTFRRK